MKQKILFISLIIISFFYIKPLLAQQDIHSELRKKIQNDTTFSLKEYYKKYHSRKPYFDTTIIKIADSVVSPVQKNAGQKTSKAVNMPADFWFPGEFEEVQAIVITWLYYHVNTSGTAIVQPVNDSLAYNNSGNVVEYFSIIDTSSETRYPIIFAQLADAIQKGGAQVWINICNASDSLIIKRYMQNNGMPLSNYRFFVNATNSIWYRDCGPVAFYYGNNDDIAFLDFEYYAGRAADDVIPIKLGNELGIPVYTTSFEYEGGNIILDGAGTLFTSDQLYAANQDTEGQIYIYNNSVYSTQKRALTKSQIHDTLNHLFGLTRLEIVPTLQNDGGTGHIDLYAAMWDENNFVFTKYPDEMSNQVDYTISAQNVSTILSMNSFHDQLYRGENIPLPRKDDGSWYTSARDFENYTRTYSNSTFVNNVIIQPIFSDDNWGAREWDLEAIEIMKEKFPGYEIIPIDIRGYKNDLYAGFDGSGGAIHCITKQIPAENPIRILHGPIQGTVSGYNNIYPIRATITNKSGIASATCYWREKGLENWYSVSMQYQGNDIFFANISPSVIFNDTVEYYISATSNNGKTITKPFTAPNGYYRFNEIQRENDKTIIIGQPYPNPSTGYVNIPISDSYQKEITVKLTNMYGQLIYSHSFTTLSNASLFHLNTFSLAAGVYVVTFIDDSGIIANRRFIVQASKF
jgi:agmatine/peptidylarginine deiminase